MSSHLNISMVNTERKIFKELLCQSSCLFFPCDSNRKRTNVCSKRSRGLSFFLRDVQVAKLRTDRSPGYSKGYPNSDKIGAFKGVCRYVETWCAKEILAGCPVSRRGIYTHTHTYIYIVTSRQ